MSDNYDKAIADLKAEIAERMRMINGLLKLRGQPPMYPDPDGAAKAGSSQIRPDQFYTYGLSTAVREFLNMRKESALGPATLEEIYDALVAGSFKFENREESIAKPAVKQSLTKNTAIFHRLPNGTYGLAEWYPNRRNAEETPKKPSKRPAKATKSAMTKAEKPQASDPPKRPTSDGGPSPKPAGETPTLKDSIRAAARAAKGIEFTKQQLLDWMDKQYPGLDVPRRRESILSLIAHMKDELGMETAKESRGREPSTYRINVATENGHHN